MVDFLSFLHVQHWIVSMEDEDEAMKDVIFEGNSCFLTGKSNFIALKPGEGHYFEPFSIPLQITISPVRGALYFLFKDLTNRAVCCTQVALEEIRYFRLTRSKFQPQLPPHASFDFGKIKLRIWTNTHKSSSFALPLFRKICALEIPPTSARRKRKLDNYTPPTTHDVEAIAKAITTIQSSSSDDQQQAFYDSITDIIKRLNGKV